MTRRVVAFFACSFLSVSASYPAAAREVDGTIERIDREDETLKLSDGVTYQLPEIFDYSAVRPGMQVVVVYEAGA
ncbi:DUF1344 domain-containing protein [Aureimonas phyllosphaerae]|uniref:DUF1344 domain-containing protein n=1 Tax=Aureimonas phyllosphaerae TaxID=1166078 RepID=A0A7W6BN31_9HYPH|nr:DUF1344 domain-containing protein [Aureimonas phyllosphaerae]MBB3935014.1 hypothetical protein [Aureimonas phyllosphaerae]MBB3959022.1 hypothetical protein [Aureimonas phyllosphaerae]SFF39807.1 Protein of unknown function [Aureimonas phyllosphaerae]